MEAVWRVGGGVHRLPRSFSLTDRRRSLTDLNASCSLADMAAGDASGKGRSANVRSEYRDAIWSPLSIRTQEPRRQHTGSKSRLVDGAERTFCSSVSMTSRRCSASTLRFATLDAASRILYWSASSE